MRKIGQAAVLLGSLLITSDGLRAQEKAAAGKIEPAAVNLGRPVDFVKDIQPILDDKCVACHNVAIAESRLILEDVPSILKGGKRGPAVMAKNPDKSLLFLVAARGQQPAMPPLPNKVSASAVTPMELGLIKQWITEGAVGSMGNTGPAVVFQAVPTTMNSIYSVAMSPWSRFAVCGRANQLDVYDVLTGEHVQRLVDPALAAIKSKDQPMYPLGAAHQDFVHALAYSPTADLFASAGYREVKLWQRGQNVQLKKFAVENPPTATAVSPDGKLLAVAQPDNSIRLIALPAATPLKSLAGHTAPVTALQFSADNAKVFSASKDKTARIFTVADGMQADILTTATEILSLTQNADGKLLVTGHQDNLIRSWNVPFDKPTADAPVKPVKEFPGSGGPVTALALLAPGTHFISAGADGQWRQWDLTSGAVVRAVNHGGPITSLSVRPDGKVVATAGANIGKLFTIEGQPAGEIKGSIAAQRKVVVMTEEDAVAKGRVALLDASFKAADKNLMERVEAAKKAVEQKEAMEKALVEVKAKETTALAARDEAQKKLDGDANNDGLKKAKADADTALTAATDATKKAQDAVENAVKAIAQTVKAQQTADEQQKAAKAAFDAETALGKQAEERLNAAKAELPMAEKPIKHVAFSPDGKLLAASGDDGVIRLFDPKAGKPLEELVGQAAATNTLVFGPERVLVSIADDKNVTLWDSNPPWQLAGVLGPKPEAPLDVAPSPFVSRVLSLAFSPNGKLLATGGGDPSRSGELMLWNMENKTFLKAFPDAHSDTVFSIDFSYDGKQLATGAADKFVKVHDVESGKLVRSFEGHTHHVLGVTFKADGSRVASAGADNAIKVWNMETGEQFRTIANYTKQVTSITYIGVTDNMISGSGDKTIKAHRSNDGGNYRNFAGPTDFVYAVGCSRDEAIAVGGGEDGVLRVWNAQNAQELFKFEPPKPPGSETAQAAAK